MATKKERREVARQERLRQEAEQAAQERRRRMMQLGALAVFGALVVVGVLIAVSQSGSDSGGGDGSVEAADVVNEQLSGIPQSGIALGDPSAKAKIVEFGDLQCPVCRDYSEQVIPGVIDQEVRPGNARLEFKNFTIIGPQSTDAALAALAAAQQGRYWNFVELFYRNQGAENSGYVTDAFLRSIAEGAGVEDLAKWDSDRRSPELEKELAGVQAEAKQLGFDSTPSFLVEGPNGRKTLVAPSPDQLSAALNEVG